MAFLEFLLAAARARIVAANVLQGVAHRLLMSVAAVRAVYVAVVVVMVMVVIAIGAMNVVVLVHRETPQIRSARIIPQIHGEQYLRFFQEIFRIFKYA